MDICGLTSSTGFTEQQSFRGGRGLLNSILRSLGALEEEALAFRKVPGV